MATMGQRIRMLREELGLKQADLGKMLGKSDATVGDYENDRTKPDIAKLHIMMKLFGVSMEYLTGHSDARYTVNETDGDDPEIRRIIDAAMRRKEIRLLYGNLADIPDDDLRTLIDVTEAFKVRWQQKGK
jgi:transcriptional regulator with XRE-family HTH domain